MRIKVGLVGTSQLSFPGPKEKVYAEIVKQMQVNAKEMQFDFVAWENHIHSAVDGILHLNGKRSSVTMQVLGFSLEIVEPVCILNVKCCLRSHCFLLLKLFVCFDDFLCFVLPPFNFLWTFPGNDSSFILRALKRRYRTDFLSI